MNWCLWESDGVSNCQTDCGLQERASESWVGRGSSEAEDVAGLSPEGFRVLVLGLFLNFVSVSAMEG